MTRGIPVGVHRRALSRQQLHLPGTKPWKPQTRAREVARGVTATLVQTWLLPVPYIVEADESRTGYVPYHEEIVHELRDEAARPDWVSLRGASRMVGRDDSTVLT